MRILFLHNDYGKYSGEEAVVDQMMADRRAEGHVVDSYRPSTQSVRGTLVGNLRGFFSGIYSFQGVREVRRKLKEFRPDVVHIHNLYPFISPAALFECKKVGVPVIMTVHNYRLICPTGLFLRDGIPCEKCLEKGSEWSCILHNCEHSYFKSLGYTLRNWFARKTKAYLNCVDYFCCLTEFQKSKLIQSGIPEAKCKVFYNYIEDCSRPKEVVPTAKTFVGFVGRLSEEKGFDLLLEVARRHPEIQFRFAGAIRDNQEVPQLPNVEFCGQLDKHQLEKFYDESYFIAMPSRYYEGFPIVLLEVFAHAKPVVAPDHGAYSELLKMDGQTCGRLFRPLDVDDLEQSIVTFWNNPQMVQQASCLAQQHFDSHFAKHIILAQWQSFLKDEPKTSK